jgi:hypothetical protein
MKQIFIVVFILMIIQVTALSQSCLPEGIIFETQAQIDSFQTNYPGCTEIEGNVTISGSNITNLNGLNMIIAIGQNLDISYNDALTSLAGMENLSSLINLSIQGNNILTDLTGLEGLISIEGFLGITGNPVLTNLTGLDNLIYIGGLLEIEFNAALTGVMGLNKLTSIGSLFQLYGNDVLTSLTELEALNFIGGSLHIYHNDALLNLTGLDNVDGSSIAALYIMNNSSLSSCEAQCICDFLANPQHGNCEILQNSLGCNSQEEVEAACASISLEEVNPSSAFSIYPNPTSNTITITITIETLTKPELNTFLTIYNISDKQLLTCQITEKQTVVDVSELPQGIYFVRITDDRTMQVGKFIIDR